MLQFIQYQQKPKVSNNGWCQKHPSLRDVQNRLLEQNSLLCGILDKLLNRIQRIKNYAARLVLKLHKSSHITPAPATLHWFPVNHRVYSKIAVLQALAYIASPAVLRSTPEAALGWQAATFTAALSFNSLRPSDAYMATVHSAVQLQLYGTISLTVWRLQRLLIFFKWNLRRIL